MRRRNAEMANVQPVIREFKYQELKEAMKCSTNQYYNFNHYFPNPEGWKYFSFCYINPLLHKILLELSQHGYAYMYKVEPYNQGYKTIELYSDMFEDKLNMFINSYVEGSTVVAFISEEIIQQIKKYTNEKYVELLNETLSNLKKTKKISVWFREYRRRNFILPQPKLIPTVPPNDFLMRSYIRYSDKYEWKYYYVQTCPEDEPLLKSIEKYDLTCKVEYGWWIYCSKEHLIYLQSFDYLDEDEKRKAVLAKLSLEFTFDDLIVIPGEEGEPDQIVTTEEGCQ